MSDITSNPKVKELSNKTLPLPSSKWDEDSEENEKEIDAPEKCPICLSHIEDKSVTNSCLHEFCFQCLKEWAKVKTVCPLCKSAFQFIIYNIRSDSDYDEFRVALHSMENPVSTNSNYFHGELERMNPQRREDITAAIIASTDVDIIRQRRRFYQNRMMACSKENKTRRDITSDFYLRNPAQKHRLAPWLRRELIILFGAKKLDVVNRISELILSAISHIELDSDEFHDEVHPFFQERTNQFLHEFVTFAKSPYDIREYDRHTMYRPKKSWNSSSETLLFTSPLLQPDLDNSATTYDGDSSSRSTSSRDGRVKRKRSSRKYNHEKKRALPVATYVITSSDSDEVEFVKSIEKPGLKTPDAVIDLISSSSDSSSTPGPSTSSGTTTSSIQIHSHLNLSQSDSDWSL